MDTLVSLRVFREIAEAGSFTAAAERLSLSAPMASKHVAHLARGLGARLLTRTRRRVSLPEAGALSYEPCSNALEMPDLAAPAIGRSGASPRRNTTWPAAGGSA